MSRYYIPGKVERHDVTVGWDAPMNTYFGQVIDKNDETDTPKHWVGTRHGEIQSVDRLQKSMEPYAAIPEPTRKNLAADRVNSPQPSRFQQETGKWFSQAKASTAPTA